MSPLLYLLIVVWALVCAGTLAALYAWWEIRKIRRISAAAQRARELAEHPERSRPGDTWWTKDGAWTNINGKICELHGKPQ